MRTTRLIACLVLTLGAAVSAQAQLPPQAAGAVTAIKAGRLVDPATGTVATNQIILVQGGRVTAAGPAVPIPAGAKVIDLSALTAVPGLVDAHNMGNNANYADIALRKAIEQGWVPGPTIIPSGLIIQDGVMTPAAFFNGGPVNGYNLR